MYVHVQLSTIIILLYLMMYDALYLIIYLETLSKLCSICNLMYIGIGMCLFVEYSNLLPTYVLILLL